MERNKQVVKGAEGGARQDTSEMLEADQVLHIVSNIYSKGKEKKTYLITKLPIWYFLVIGQPIEGV